MKLVTALVLMLLSGIESFGQQPIDVDWDKLVIKEFYKELNEPYEDSIKRPIFNDQQKRLNAQRVNMSGILIQSDSIFILVNPMVAAYSVRYIPKDQIVHLENPIGDGLKKEGAHIYTVKVNGSLLVNISNDPQKLSYMMKTPDVVVVEE